MIYKRSGRYAVRIDLDAGANGRRRRKNVGTFSTRKEAEKAEREALSERDRGIDLAPSTVTVGQLLERYIADRKAKGRALRTLMRYEDLARLTIAPHIGALTLIKLRPAHISEWMATVSHTGSAERGPLAPKSVWHAFTFLRAALRWAVKLELVVRNPAESIDAPSIPTSKAVALNRTDVDALFAAADGTRWGPFFRLALGSAARRGELLALRWSDVSTKSDAVGQATTISIARAFIEPRGKGGRIVEKTTKTDQIRHVFAGALANEALRHQRALQARDKLAAGAAYADSGHVFQHPGGGPMAPDFASKAFARARRAANLPAAASLHSLRHTAATWMLTSGVDIATVARVLGHSSPATTLRIYAHVLAGSPESAVATIDAMLAR